MPFREPFLDVSRRIAVLGLDLQPITLGVHHLELHPLGDFGNRLIAKTGTLSYISVRRGGIGALDEGSCLLDRFSCRAGISLLDVSWRIPLFRDDLSPFSIAGRAVDFGAAFDFSATLL